MRYDNPLRQKAWDRHSTYKVWTDSELTNSQTVYRYVQWNKNARQMFEEKELYFSAPHRWKDPFEKWWCQQLFRAGSQLADVDAYGLCTTRSWGDEPYWRLYDHSGTVPVIRLTTSVRRLSETLGRFVADRQAKAYVGRVAYHNRVSLESEADRLRLLGRDGELARHVAHALMLKRSAFRFENEHRAVIVERGQSGDHRRVAFEPTELFTKVMLAPSMSKRDEEAIRSFLARRGFTEDCVVRSSLYDRVC